ncbi:MAG: hypothetical protein IPL50_10220 [Chitinophagaceae bacterium]|nr:hypothetical protein [Chitinophagaceae bacterium]
MKKPVCFLLLLFMGNLAIAQSKADIKILQQKEDSLRALAVQIIQGRNADDRFSADSSFTRMLVRALKTRHSFHYPFESFQTISVLYAPDSVFRIFTWQMVINENVIRQHGAIQMKTWDGSLKLYPLIDKSDVTGNVADTIGNHLGWIGAIYYKLIQKKSGNQNYYTLLGFDENNIRSSRKIIEVLHFANDEPVFGGRYFSYEEDSVFKTSQSRYIMEYKKEAGPRLNYDTDLDMIIMEHLISESKEPHKKWTLVGDGDYEGFAWKNGKWVHIEKVFNVVTPDGQAPVPNPIRDPSGNLDENKLKGADPVKPKGKGNE